MKTHRRLLKLLLPLSFLWLSIFGHCGFFFQDSWDVPGDFGTIQEAIDFAEPGDNVIIQPGVYSPSTNGEYFPIFMQDGVNLTGENSADVILDAQNTAGILDVFNYSGTISQLTLINGLSDQGGAIAVQNSNPVLQNLYIIGNRAQDAGSGIYLINSDGTIIQNSVIADNADFSGGGTLPAQVECFDTSVTFINNVVANGDSDGLRLQDGSSGTFENNIFYSNGSSGTGVGFSDTDPATSAGIQYNITFDNAAADYFLNGMNLTSTEANDLNPDDAIANNFTADPLFTDPGADDYTLQSGSPASNAGDPNAQFNNQDGSRNTIGAYGGPEAINP